MDIKSKQGLTNKFIRKVWNEKCISRVNGSHIKHHSRQSLTPANLLLVYREEWGENFFNVILVKKSGRKLKRTTNKLGPAIQLLSGAPLG